MRTWGISGLGGLIGICAFLIVFAQYPDRQPESRGTRADNAWVAPSDEVCRVLAATLAERTRWHSVTTRTYVYPSRQLLSDGSGNLIMYDVTDILDRHAWLPGRLDYCLHPLVAHNPAIEWATSEFVEQFEWEDSLLADAFFAPTRSCLVFTGIRIEANGGRAQLSVLDLCLYPPPDNHHLVILERRRGQWHVVTELRPSVINRDGP